MKLLPRARNDSHFWRVILIAFVLVLALFSNYSNAASWQPFAAGGAGWEVLDSGSSATYRFNGSERLKFSGSQWYQTSQLDGGTWSAISGPKQLGGFIGDGKAHSLGNGWSYMYNGSNAKKQDSAWFSLNGNYRLAYNYTEGQWWQKGTDWSKLGSSGISSTFLGDGTARSIGSGWSYMYNGSNARKQDSAWFSLNGNYRLAYNYTEGQWWQKGVDWSKLGNAGLSTAFIGDGTACSIGSGWSYMYNGSNARKQDSAWFSLNGNYRLAYNYTEGQWWQKGVDWSKLGSSGISSTFVGDGADHAIGSGWTYMYNGTNARKQDSAWFSDNGSWRFAYNYTEGQWWHKSADWRKLSSSGISTTFLGDGNYHQVWSDGASYRYLASSGLGYWSSSGVINNNDFRINYGTNQWYRYYDGSTIYDAVDYMGNRQYLLADYMYWTSSGLKSSTYTGSSYGTDVQHVLWSDTTNKTLATWYIFTPGTDLKWSGGALDVNVVNIHKQPDANISTWMRMWEQYTKEDVITVEFDLEGGVSLATVLEGLGYIKTTYGKTIDDLAVHSHGKGDSFWFGSKITTLNYGLHYPNWNKPDNPNSLANLMTDKGQIQLYVCLVGAPGYWDEYFIWQDGGANMLSDIALSTNTKIFANINSLWNYPAGSVNGSGVQEDNVWNYNYLNPFFGSIARESGDTDYTKPKVNFIDLDFEYQSDSSGKRAYKMLFDPYDPGYAQADMVYWWNNGDGRQ